MERGLRSSRGGLVAGLAALIVGATVVAAPAPAHAASSASTGGVTLDLYGGLHLFGGATIDTAGAPYWPNWDIARAVVVLPDGSGGWTLDGFGGIHNWGMAPPIATPAYWPNWDIARGLVVLPDMASGYVLDGFGVLHAFGPHAPQLTPAPPSWPGWDIARGVAVTTNSAGTAVGGWTMDGFGGVHAFGAPTSVSGAPPYEAGRDVWQKLHLNSSGTALYSVARWGVVDGGTSDWTGYGDWGAWNAIRDVVLFSTTGSAAQPVSASARQQFDAATSPLGGVVLDLYGGLHPFGGFPLNPTGAPYWSGWDIARSAAVLPDGSGGWTLDGFGGIHNWGTAPAITTPSYWSGWDIARGLVVLPDERSGYVLDGFGGIHTFGPHAPAFASPSYTLGTDISRGISVVTDTSGDAVGGWVLDGHGTMRAFGNVPAVTDPVASPTRHDVWEGLHISLSGQLYSVARYGLVSAPGMSPTWAGYSDFGGWNAIRDVLIGNPMFGGGHAQPVSPAASRAFTLASSDGVITRTACGGTNLIPPHGKWIVISTGCQELSAYQDGVLLQDTLVTTGRPALPTEHGHTSVLRKNHPWLMISTFPKGSQYYYNPTWVQYVTWIWPNGTGIHDAYWEPDSALGPGSPLGPYASHGCVHVTLAMAVWIYNWADVGIPVDVV